MNIHDYIHVLCIILQMYSTIIGEEYLLILDICRLYAHIGLKSVWGNCWILSS